MMKPKKFNCYKSVESLILQDCKPKSSNDPCFVLGPKANPALWDGIPVMTNGCWLLATDLLVCAAHPLSSLWLAMHKRMWPKVTNAPTSWRMYKGLLPEAIAVDDQPDFAIVASCPGVYVLLDTDTYTVDYGLAVVPIIQSYFTLPAFPRDLIPGTTSMEILSATIGVNLGYMLGFAQLGLKLLAKLDADNQGHSLDKYAPMLLVQGLTPIGILMPARYR